MAELRKIIVPTLELDTGDAPKFDFKRFLHWTLAVHPSYNSDATGMRAALRLERKLENIPDDMPQQEPSVDADEPKPVPVTMLLDEDDWTRLKNAVENPHGGYPVRPAHRMLPLVEAVCDAKID